MKVKMKKKKEEKKNNGQFALPLAFSSSCCFLASCSSNSMILWFANDQHRQEGGVREAFSKPQQSKAKKKRKETFCQ